VDLGAGLGVAGLRGCIVTGYYVLGIDVVTSEVHFGSPSRSLCDGLAANSRSPCL